MGLSASSPVQLQKGGKKVIVSKLDTAEKTGVLNLADMV